MPPGTKGCCLVAGLSACKSQAIWNICMFLRRRESLISILSLVLCEVPPFLGNSSKWICLRGQGDCSPAWEIPLNCNPSLLANSPVFPLIKTWQIHMDGGDTRAMRMEKWKGRWRAWPAVCGGGSVQRGVSWGRVVQGGVGYKHLLGTNTPATWARQTRLSICVSKCNWQAACNRIIPEGAEKRQF